MSLEHVVGTATVISSLAGRFVGYPAQIRLILKTRVVSNLSVTLHSIGFISCLLWTWHGWLNHDWVILLTQGLAGIAATGAMLFLIWWFRPRKVAQESLIDFLVTLVALDGEVHPKEQAEVDAFARTWKLEFDWSSAAAVLALSPPQRQERLQQQLRRYLSQRPPVEQMRELRDLAWVIVEADGTVTDDERRAVAQTQAALSEALAPFANAEAPLFRVVVVPRSDGAESAPSGLQRQRFADQALCLSEIAMTEPIARQYAAELRKSGWLALMVPAKEFN